MSNPEIVPLYAGGSTGINGNIADRAIYVPGVGVLRLVDQSAEFVAVETNEGSQFEIPSQELPPEVVSVFSGSTHYALRSPDGALRLEGSENPAVVIEIADLARLIEQISQENAIERVSEHNFATEAHADIRSMISGGYYFLTTPANGQNLFNLPFTPIAPSRSQLFLNGWKYQYAQDYQIIGAVLTWLNSIVLDSDDRLEVYA